MEKKFVKDLKKKERIEAFFMLRKKNLKLTKYDKAYLELGFSDKTGNIEGRLWDDAEKYNGCAETGDIVRVIGTVDEFREEKQIKVDSIARADDRAFRYEDMVRVVEDRDGICARVRECLNGIVNPWIKSLAGSFVADEALMSKFRDGIGGKSWHNAYIGGLIEHTYEVMHIADEMCRLYPEADRDTVIFGAFVHDIGKVFELDPRKMEYTIEGGLVGHIAIGHKVLTEKIRGIEGFPPDLSLRLEHIILSHHGKYEQQSPVLPKTLEATIIYQTDDLVSQANAIREIMTAQSEEGKVWSNYVTMKSRKYYIRSAAEEGWDTPTPSETIPETGEDLFT